MHRSPPPPPTHLVGRTIVAVRWLSVDDADGIDLYNRPVVLVLDDGTLLFPMSDAEGKDGGSLHMQLAHGDYDVAGPVWQR